MKISIVLAAYNGEKYLKQQLESFCYQTRFPDELVIVDDCSTDSTPTILKEFRDGLFQDLHTTPWRVSVDDLPLFLVRTIRSLKSGDVSEKQC